MDDWKCQECERYLEDVNPLAIITLRFATPGNTSGNGGALLTCTNPDCKHFGLVFLPSTISRREPAEGEPTP